MSPEAKQEERNRKVLLNKVKNDWIKGVLEKSLHEQIPIILDLEEHPSEVASPWNLEIINPEKSQQPLPKGTLAIDVFDQLGEGVTLLLLGEAGSGKTITLLQLAKDLLIRAEEDSKKLIPIVLNLSSWADKKQSIDAWVVEELNSRYDVPKRFAEQWIKNQQLLLLLDGLDEIRDLEKRSACVTALNDFQKVQATEMVVCCRMKDYKKLGKRLKLRFAIALKPLTSTQIHAYIDQLPSNLTALKTLLTQDQNWEKLAKSPLMLNIMVLAYQGIKVIDIPVSTTDSNKEKQLWEDYVNRMFRGSRIVSYDQNRELEEKQSYSREYATRYLIWIAQQMIQYSKSIFLIEKMQPCWLNNKEVVFYRIGLLIMSSLFGALFGILIGDISILEIKGIVYGTTMGIIFGMGLGKDLSINLIDSVIWSWETSKYGLFLYFVPSIVIGFSIIRSSPDIPIIIAVYSTFVGCLRMGFKFKLIELEVIETTYPNQGITIATTNALKIGLYCLPIYELAAWQVDKLAMINDLRFSLSLGLFLGLLHMTNTGGKIFIQHFALRLNLFLKGVIPLNYVHFLDWAKNKLFLQQVGGGYIFIHRSLMEHFAAMENSQ